ncbi:Cysteine protease ATG4B [Lamellibrachia satsuma]|nr:Cysteine protease ATG4B [Lamellibrachia satsuma]
MDVAQTAGFIQSMTYETGILEYEDFPKTESPVWILGKTYSTLYDMDELKRDVLSRGTGPTSDMRWGCMLRCGQMMLAQALGNLHLGRDWCWDPDKYNPKYHEILRMFLDKKDSYYSIHQIASMGVSEGKEVGEWFGPNTIAQVLKKLAVYDEWSNLVLHISLDNTVITEDIKTLCRCSCGDKNESGSATDKQRSEEETATTLRNRKATLHNGLDPQMDGAHKGATGHSMQSSGKCDQCHNHWKPLLLIIPLRLGLSEMNSVYHSQLKMCFTMKQSVGIIGGEPNHAHWFIGYVDDEVVYLDPHTTQPYVDVTAPGESDESYHCRYASRMRIEDLDPSMALGFYCSTEAEFDDWTRSVYKPVAHGQHTPIFEVVRERPTHFPPFEPYTPQASGAEFTVVEDRQFDTDEEFELI